MQSKSTNEQTNADFIIGGMAKKCIMLQLLNCLSDFDDPGNGSFKDSVK